MVPHVWFPVPSTPGGISDRWCLGHGTQTVQKVYWHHVRVQTLSDQVWYLNSLLIFHPSILDPRYYWDNLICQIVTPILVPETSVILDPSSETVKDLTCWNTFNELEYENGEIDSYIIPLGFLGWKISNPNNALNFLEISCNIDIQTAIPARVIMSDDDCRHPKSRKAFYSNLVCYTFRESIS